MAGDIYDLVNKATQSQSESKASKVQLGYTVDTYKGVLAELKQMEANGFVADVGGDAMGDDYDSIGNMRWDNNDFSIHATACLWKMNMGLFGSLPILYTDCRKNGIISVSGMSEESVAKTGNPRVLPLALSSDINCGLPDDMGFESGVYIDLDGKAPDYFEKFFRGQNASQSFTADIVNRLVANKCLMAQIVTQDGNSCEAVVIGKTPNNNTSTSQILVSPAMFATGALANFGINVTMSGFDGSGNAVNSVILPTSNNNRYRCLIERSGYNTKNGTINKFDVINYKKWANNNAQSTGQADAGHINQMQGSTYYVRLYIPANKRELAESIIPEGTSTAIYQTYSAARYGAGNIPAGLNADVRRMLECIDLACQEFGLSLYTTDKIKDAGGVPAAMSKYGGWTHGHGQATAMKGVFYIPQGWPMCEIKQDYRGRSGADQRKKGHPKQGDGNAVPWVEYQSKERMDTALQKLDADVLNGNKDREWYSERLRRAQLGPIMVYCNSAIADMWNEVFKKSKLVYESAVSKYNLGRSSEEQITLGEILLRCAPCLCCINGENAIHRQRGRGYERRGHECGQAIDFAHDLNHATNSLSENLSTPFAAGLEVAYRPWFHYLFECHGGWGGAYRYMGTKFDSMHLQIG